MRLRRCGVPRHYSTVIPHWQTPVRTSQTCAHPRPTGIFLVHLHDVTGAQMLHLDALDSDLGITMHLNCPSADLRAALAVYDVMQTARSAVRTVCVGAA